ncbi:MAG: DUF2959 family protein [Pseudomonadota bacterium]|nr:DUF2959 family protein [Pseudomonadota bacterium]
MRGRIDGVEDVSEALFAEWEEELDPGYRRAGERARTHPQ